jgi:DNA-binding Lrp family transcriptional regulator
VLLLVEAFVLVRVRPARPDEASNVMKTVKETIAKVRGVKEIKGVFGRYDFVATAEVGTAEELGTLVTDAIRNIKGVAETETLVVGF